MSDTILVINAGSSSIKFQLFAIAPEKQLDRRLRGQIEGIGTRPRLVASDATGQRVIDKVWGTDEVGELHHALDRLVVFLREYVGRLPVAVGHRVVHGGPEFIEPTLLNSRVLDHLQRFVPLAPLHQPNNLAPIRIVLERQPHLLQVACFDTAFHRHHSEIADRYAIPDRFYREGVRRYGFHGLSYEYIASRIPQVAPEIGDHRVVVAHLGSGASMCAQQGGKSIESSMGFTALDGLPMGTRPGQIDAGVVLYLMNEKGMSVKDVEHFLYNDCGLKGLSGISNDVRDLLSSVDPRAKLALDYFAYRIALFGGMLATALGGIDGLVFTAGIGENAPAIRRAVVARMSCFGIELSETANGKNQLRISSDASRVGCYVVPTDEELMIARHTLQMLQMQKMPKEKRA
ncbi:acetate kinase [Hyphomicrobium denitrificans ATCC 51888]|uniref:Acetate kinase n=1 Tax=Hyphomicrobium denitrificans (strain ATCC 51888 / DSM 1869 / NCIMB 11706 / TK 0415) TaxID=582899 RepID=D8JPU6_HYPDA|nr:acetate/propionate family kinase [Hyphomicrobium denitrificans]ADJ23830.1 acetate kinase [Hyphomicrobium denitrificans ATCC 51888]